MKILRLSLLALFIGSASYLGAVNNVTALLEKQPPIVDGSSIPSGLSNSGPVFSINCTDQGAGLSTVSVSLLQGEKSKSLYTKTLNDSQHALVAEISSSELSSTFAEGTAQLLIEATDSSIWKNTVSKKVNVVLDFTSPRLALVSNQHIASEGGAEFVLLEASDTNLETVEVTIENHIFKGIPAEKFDPALAGKNIYAVLFALPIAMKANTSISAHAIDSVGNSSTAPVNFTIKPFKRASTSPRISSHFVNNKVNTLYNEFIDKISTTSKLGRSSNEVEIFRAVNEDYRSYLQQRLAALPLGEDPLPKETFLKPMASATTSNFGEARSYTLNGEAAGGSTHDGLDLASVKQDKVLASNMGTVVFAGSFGIYGNAVVIDHGMGLTSLYGHLSKLSVEEGMSVSRGQLIGRSGETGLAGGDHLHFEFRIANIPVVPKEWWDSHWIRDNIHGKITELKDSLGVESQG